MKIYLHLINQSTVSLPSKSENSTERLTNGLVSPPRENLSVQNCYRPFVFDEEECVHSFVNLGAEPLYTKLKANLQVIPRVRGPPLRESLAFTQPVLSLLLTYKT